MRSVSRLILTPAVALALGACSDPQRSPTELAATGGPAFDAAQPWGPETPNFNLEVVLRGDGFGLVKFRQPNEDRKSTRLNSSHVSISYAVFCLKKKIFTPIT